MSSRATASVSLIVNENESYYLKLCGGVLLR